MSLKITPPDVMIREGELLRQRLNPSEGPLRETAIAECRTHSECFVDSPSDGPLLIAHSDPFDRDRLFTTVAGSASVEDERRDGLFGVQANGVGRFEKAGDRQHQPSIRIVSKYQ